MQRRLDSAFPCCLSLALLAHALLVLPARATDEEADARPDPAIKAYAQARQGQYFYGIYMLGNKVGWVSETTRLDKFEGKSGQGEAMISEQRGEIRLKLFGTENRLDFTAQSVYNLGGDGPLVYAEETSADGTSKSRSTATAEPGGFAVMLQVEGQTRRFQAGPSRDNLRMWIEVENWLRAPRQPDEKRKNYSFDFDKLSNISSTDNRVDPDEEEEMTFVARRQSRWGGVPVTLTKLKAKMGTITANVEVLPDGTPITMSFGPMTARLEEEETAKNFELVVGDMLAFVPSNKDLGPPEKVRRAKIELRGLGDFQVPSTARQRVLETGDDFALLDLQSGRKAPTPAPLSEDEIRSFTASSLRVQADHQQIIDLARKIVGSEQDRVKQSWLLQAWVFQNINGSYSHNADTALRVLENKAGDCTENALLFVTLARALGIPAREVSGLIFSSDTKPGFYWHAWAEVHDGARWVGVDPSFNQVGLDAAHIKMDEDAASYRVVGVMGQLEIRVLDFQVAE